MNGLTERSVLGLRSLAFATTVAIVFVACLSSSDDDDGDVRCASDAECFNGQFCDILPDATVGRCEPVEGSGDAGVPDVGDAGDVDEDTSADVADDAPSDTEDAPDAPDTSDAGDAPDVDAADTADSDVSDADAGLDSFVFETAPASSYRRVDRAGHPYRSMLLHMLGDKDALNAADPVDDASLSFVSDIFDSLQTWHLGASGARVPDNTGLEDDILALGFSPCDPPGLGAPSDCDDQVAFLFLDALRIDPMLPSSYPNGRTLDEPVLDILLSLILLDQDEEDLTTFMNLDGDAFVGPSLNPLENDVPFGESFPYVAPPH